MINIEELVLNLTENPTKTKKINNLFQSYLEPKIIKELQENISFITEAYETTLNNDYLNIFIQMAILGISSPEMNTIIEDACLKEKIPKQIIQKDNTKNNALIYQKYTIFNKNKKTYVYDKSKGFIEIITCDWKLDSIIFAQGASEQYFYSFKEFINNAHTIKENGLIKKILSRKLTIKDLNVSIINDAIYKEIPSFKEESDQITIMHLIFPIFFKKINQFKKWYKDNLTSQKINTKTKLVRSLQELYAFLNEEPTKKEIEEKIENIDSILKKDLKININTINIFILLKKLYPQYIEIRQKLIQQIPIWNNDELYKLFNEIPLKNISFFIETISMIQPLEHTLRFLKYFNLKFLNKLLNKKDIPQLLEFIQKSNFRNNLSSDFILWLWGNKNYLSKENSINFLTPNNLFRSLQYGEKKSINEIKKILLNQEDILKFIAYNENTVKELISSIKNSILNETEKEIMFFQAKKSFPKFKALFPQKIKEIIKQKENITSFYSYRLKEKELQNINQIQIPENLDAIATAKEFGDLKENAEFKAAKERQKYLSARKMQLQLDLVKLKPTNFKDIIVENTIIIGCTVNLSNNQEYSILGVSDSNPEKKYISCNTSLAQVLLGKKVNQKINLPNGEQTTISRISSLSDKILKDML